MYHLFVTAKEGAWERLSCEYDLTRAIKEYTDENIFEKYKSFNDSLISELKGFPVIFAYETPLNSNAKLGFIKNVKKTQNKIVLEYEFFSEASKIPVSFFSKFELDLDLGKLEMNRTHWAIKDVELNKILLEANLITKEQSIALLMKIVKNIFNSTDKQYIAGMPKEESKNSGLTLLMLLSQAYYGMLENVVSCPCGSVDLELNHSYLWIINSITKLLENHPDLQDFPIEFEPIFPDLFPSTIKVVDWDDMVSCEAEKFLSEVQKYTLNKEMHELEEGSSGWLFVEIYKSSILKAIEVSKKYTEKMKKSFDNMLQKKINENSDTSKLENKNIYKKNELRNKTFISYSHKDKKFLEELRTHLKPMERNGINVWSDKDIKAGSSLLKTIEDALQLTKVGVLLVTKDFLASDFIYKNELNPLLKAAKEKGVTILWVLVRDCNWKKTSIKDCKAAFPTNQALATKGRERDSAWVTICNEIQNALNS